AKHGASVLRHLMSVVYGHARLNFELSASETWQNVQRFDIDSRLLEAQSTGGQTVFRCDMPCHGETPSRDTTKRCQHEPETPTRTATHPHGEFWHFDGAQIRRSATAGAHQGGPDSWRAAARRLSAIGNRADS